MFDLMRALNRSKEDLHRLLPDEAKANRVSIHPTTSVELPVEVIDAGIRLPGHAEPFVTAVVKNEPWRDLMPICLNPFEDNVVREPREVSFSVSGLNDAQLEKLLAKFHELDNSGRDRGTARATLGEGLAVSAFPLYVPV
jgi:hypothetical protein